MSPVSRFQTLVTSLSNTVVLVGGGGRLAHSALDAAMASSGARLVTTELSRAATVCAEARPYAIVIPQEVYDFGGSEFDALARDVGAGLVVVPQGVAPSVLAAMLQEEAMRLS